MKPNLHPEFRRAMQANRQEEISRAAARKRAEGSPGRIARPVRWGRAIAFFQHALRGSSVELLGEVDAPTNIHVNVFPVAGKLPLPK